MAAFGAPSTSPAQPLTSDQAAYQSFVREFRAVALRRGIPEALYDRAFRGLTPDPEVIERNNRQPEFVLPVSHYMALVITDTRVRQGRDKLSEHAADLVRIERRYGVDRHVLAAIWGMETLYGKLRGKRNVIRSLSHPGLQGAPGEVWTPPVAGRPRYPQGGRHQRGAHDRLVGGGHGPHAVHPHQLRGLRGGLHRRRAGAISGTAPRTRWRPRPTICARTAGSRAGRGATG